jgi:hypothetical protein
MSSQEARLLACLDRMQVGHSAAIMPCYCVKDLHWSVMQDQLKTLENDGLKQELQTLRNEIKQIGADVTAGSQGAASAAAPSPSGAPATNTAAGGDHYRGKISQMSSEVRDDNPYRYTILAWRFSLMSNEHCSVLLVQIIRSELPS